MNLFAQPLHNRKALIGVTILAIVILVAIWWTVCAVFDMRPVILPTPVAVCAPAPEAPGTEATELEGAPGFPAAGARVRLAPGSGDDAPATSDGVAAGFGAVEGGADFLATTFFLTFTVGFCAAVWGGGFCDPC